MSELNLGDGFSLRFTSWRPDRSIPENRTRYRDVPDHDRIGVILTCRHGIEGSLTFDRGPAYAGLFGERPRWNVLSEDPLTLNPSVDCGECGCHGHIREGRWADA